MLGQRFVPAMAGAVARSLVKLCVHSVVLFGLMCYVHKGTVKVISSLCSGVKTYVTSVVFTLHWV